jgi:hypothetical protein
MGFQRGGALVTAGLATLLTNAIPIAAGMTIFHEPLPDGAFGAMRILAFSTIVVSAVFLASRKGGNQPLRGRDEQANNGEPSDQDPGEAVSTEIAA